MDNIIKNLKIISNGKYSIYLGNLKNDISNLNIDKKKFKLIENNISSKFSNKRIYKVNKSYFCNLVYEKINIDNQVIINYYRQKINMIFSNKKNILVHEIKEPVDKYSIPPINNYDFIEEKSIVEYSNEIVSLLFISEKKCNYIKLIFNIDEKNKNEINKFIKQFNKNFL